MNIYQRMRSMSEVRRSLPAWVGLVLVCLMLASAVVWAQTGGNPSGGSSGISGSAIAGALSGANGLPGHPTTSAAC